MLTAEGQLAGVIDFGDGESSRHAPRDDWFHRPVPNKVLEC